MSLTARRTTTARTRYKPEDIVAKLRRVDVLTSQGHTLADAIRQIGVSEVTYYRWRQECQCRCKFPQMCRSKIPQLGGFSVISRPGGDRVLHFWVADRGGAAAVPGLAS